MSHAYRPDYDLRHRALCYRRTLPAPAGTASRRRDGMSSRPALHLTVLRGGAEMRIEHHFTSGHAWLVDVDREAVSGEVAAVLGETVAAEVAALQAERFSPEDLLILFEPRAGAGPNWVPPREADFLELGRSVTLDGRVPCLTLRLGRAHDEIVLNHSFVWPADERRLECLERLEPPATPQALAAIAARLGADMVAAAHRRGSLEGCQARRARPCTLRLCSAGTPA